MQRELPQKNDHVGGGPDFICDPALDVIMAPDQTGANLFDSGTELHARSPALKLLAQADRYSIGAEIGCRTSAIAGGELEIVGRGEAISNIQGRFLKKRCI